MATADPLSYVSSTRAFAYLTERGEDALHAVKEALGSGSNKYLDADPSAIRKQLESGSDVERLEGVKHVLALISKGRDPTPFLASVFKLASTTSLEVHKLVYIVVLRYARTQPDLALLSINSFQRDLTEPNALIRGMALRTLSGMRVKAAESIVTLAIGKAVRDTHPYVRRVAAYALMRSYQADPDNAETYVDLVHTLLRDRSPQVLGPALAAYTAICPDKWDMLHRHFRKLCYALSDMDAWSQPGAVNLLVHYARLHLLEPHDAQDMDPDLALLVDHIEPLLASTNPGVVTAAVQALLFVAPAARHRRAIAALVRLVRDTPDVAYIATLRVLALDAAYIPLVAPMAAHFYVRADDPEYLARAKLRVLLRIAQPGTARALADELVVYTQAASVAVALDSVTALGNVACRFDAHAAHCLKLLIGIAQDPSSPEPVASRAVQVAKMLMAIPNVIGDKVIVRVVAQFALRLFAPLARAGRPKDAHLPSILLDPSSRAAALWMLGQYARATLVPATDTTPSATLCELLVPDMLRCLTAHWHKEHASVQCAALTLAAKAITVLPDVGSSVAVRSATLTLYYALLALGAQSRDADVRDRARFYGSLTRKIAEEQAPHAPDVDAAHEQFWAQHHELDRQRLPGVRLRRAQVQHVLFAHDTADAASIGTQLALDTPACPPEAVPTLVGPVFLRGAAAANVPAWRPASELPPAIVRMPDAEPAHAEMANVRSLSSASAPPPAAAVEARAPVERVVLTPKETRAPPRAAYQARYADLDAFFDEDEDEEVARVSLDEAAPEDEEYALSDSSDSSDSA